MLPDDQRASAAKKVLCPFLGAAVKAGVPVDVNGNINVNDLEPYLAKIGFDTGLIQGSKHLADSLVPPKGGEKPDVNLVPNDGQVNVFNLKGVKSGPLPIEHKTSTGIRDILAKNGDEKEANARFDALFGAAAVNGKVTMASLGQLLNKAFGDAPSIYGTIISTIEQALVMSGDIGQGEKNTRYIDLEEARRFFVHSEFPQRILDAEAVPGKVTSGALLGVAAGIATKRLFGG